MGDVGPGAASSGGTRRTVTERRAATFAELAQSLRHRSHDPQAVVHFVNRLAFCMFAEHEGLLPNEALVEGGMSASGMPGLPHQTPCWTSA